VQHGVATGTGGVDAVVGVGLEQSGQGSKEDVDVVRLEADLLAAAVPLLAWQDLGLPACQNPISSDTNATSPDNQPSDS